MNKDILDQLAKDTAPRNADEFFMGMHLAALLDLMEDMEADPVTFDAIVEGSKDALKYWRVKYSDEIIAAGDQASESLGDR